jgi:hypothetical protein
MQEVIDITAVKAFINTVKLDRIVWKKMYTRL